MENRTLKAALGSQGQVRIISSIGNADRCIGFGHGALSGGNVGSALEQFRGHADRNRRRSDGHRLHGNGEIGGGFADEHGDGVLKLCACDSDISRTGLRAPQRGFGFDHGDLIVDAGFIKRTSQVVGLLIRRNCVIVDFLQSVLAANLEKILRQAGLLGQTLVLEIRCTDLGSVLGLAHRVANLAPKVGLPGRLERQRVERALQLWSRGSARAGRSGGGRAHVRRGS